MEPMEAAGEMVRFGRTKGIVAVRIWCMICFFCLMMTMGCGGCATPPGGYAEGHRHHYHWTELTRENFTSKLKEHEFSLCVATLPWCGESKRLMQDIGKVVRGDPHSFPGLQLFFVHTNKDRLFGNAILGDSMPPSFALFRYGTPYKYTGRRSTSSMMASIRQGISVLRSDTVLGRIASPQDLEIFAYSTDKAVVLFEFCGWEMKLQQKHRKTSATDDVESVHSEEIVNARESPGTDEVKNNEVLESSNLDGVTKSSYKARDSSYWVQSEEKQIETESTVQNNRDKDHLPKGDDRGDDSIGETSTEKVEHLERRIGDGLDDIADCMNQNALYCISGNTCQNLDHTTLTDKNTGDNSEPAAAKVVKIEEELRQDQLLCTSEEYETFKVVYGNVSKLAAENILTPQRIRFATATNGEIASHVGISTQGRPWVLMYLIRDFDRLPYSFNGLGTVEDFLFDHSPPLVVELEGEGRNSASSALLNDTPSVILFIDRMSNSPDVREKSKAALDAFQELSYHYASLGNDGGQNGRQRRKQTMKKKQVSEVKEKVAAVQVNEKRTIQMVQACELLSLLEKPDLHIGPLQEDESNEFSQLLTDLRQLRNKFSGKDVLVGNLDVVMENLSQLKLLEEQVRQSRAAGGASWLLPIQVSRDHLQSDNQRDETLGHHSDEDLSNDVTLPNEQMNLEDDDGLGSNAESHIFDMDGEAYHEFMTESASVGEDEGKTELSDSGRSSSIVEGETGRRAVRNDEGKTSTLQMEADGKLTNEEDIQDFIVDEDNDSNTCRNELGFYFIDGEDPMKAKLARRKETPALVIIDPERQAHYSFPSNVALNVTTLSSFVDSFLSGVLQRTVFSEPESPPSREPPRPPFVNQDFHEMYPVPRVTVDSFLEMVKGVSQADEKSSQFTLRQSGREESEENGGNLTGSAWDRDVLVLFTTPWCGFCKRMELVVREVYRSLQLVRSHEIPSSGGINNSEDQQNLNDPTASRPARLAGGQSTVKKAVQTRREDAAVRERPMLFQMDCTMNDCSDYLGEIFEEETYPAVVLFPARNKLSPVIYSGAPTVREIFDFLKVHGAATSSAEKHEGNSLNENLAIRGKVCTNTDDVSCDTVVSSTSIKIGSGPGRGSKHEAATLLWELNSRQMDLGKNPEVGSILLASEKLLESSQVFENSIILIVSSNQQGMLHGLIVNKPMPWTNVVGLDSKMEELLNPAALGYGGPVVENHRPFLVLTHLQGLQDFTEVVPGIYCGFIPSKGRVLDMIHTGILAAKDFWFFLGYSSWTWRQLQNELTGDLWQLRPFSDNLVKWPIQWNT
ncbi:unnamed protein product [Calypogeia fissa]